MAHQLPSESLFGDYSEWPGRDVLDSGGERLGGVREIYLDRETGHPEWVLVDVENDTARFVPLVDASIGEATIRVAHSASEIRSAPGIGAEAQIDQAEERRLYAHYGLGYSEDDSGSGLPSDDAPVPQVDSRDETLQSAAPPATSGSTPEAHTETFSSATPEESVPPWRRPESSAPPSAWGTPEPPVAEESTTPPDADTGSSWSAAAEASIDAPPPAEPPSAAEIAAADIPEPPAASDRAPDIDEAPTPVDPAPPVLEAASEPPALEAPDERPALEPPTSAASEPETNALEEPVVSPFTPTVSPPELATAGLGPEVIPDELPGGPSASSAGVPPRPAQTERPAWTSPQQPESSGGALAAFKRRPKAIAGAAAVAAVLFLVIRRLR